MLREEDCVGPEVRGAFLDGVHDAFFCVGETPSFVGMGIGAVDGGEDVDAAAVAQDVCYVCAGITVPCVGLELVGVGVVRVGAESVRERAVGTRGGMAGKGRTHHRASWACALR